MMTHGLWCPQHVICTLTCKASSAPQVACFFMAPPFIIHHINYKGGWVSGYMNWWWDRGWKRAIFLTLQSILMHHLLHVKWACIRAIFSQKKSFVLKHNTPATAGQAGDDESQLKILEKENNKKKDLNDCFRWCASSKKCVIFCASAVTQRQTLTCK